jgi:hypothetical protein
MTRTAPDDGRVDTGTGAFFSGIGHGIENLITSAPGIAIHALTTPPWETAKDYAAGTYEFGKSFAPLARAGGNLITGDFGDAAKFYDQYKQNFYSDPLGHSLAILTLGRAAGARIGALKGLPKGASGADALRALSLGWDRAPFEQGPSRYISVSLGKDIEGVGQQGTEIVTRSVPRGHARANQAYAIDSLLKQLPHDFPLLGVDKRAARTTRAKGRTRYLRLLSAPEYIAFQKTGRALTKTEAVAAGLRNKLPFEQDVKTWTEKLQLLGTDEAEATLRQLKDPKVMALYVSGSPRILAHEAAGTALEPVRREVLLRTGAITPEEAEAAPWRLTRQLRGAHLATPSWIYKQRRKIDAQIRQIIGEKGRLVTAAKAFGNKDMREAFKAARAASNQALKESRFRAQIHEDLSKAPRLPHTITRTARVDLLKRIRTYDIPSGTHTELEADVRKNGIREPIEIHVDAEGNAKIHDGNHRLGVAERLGLDEVPIKLTMVKSLTGKKFLLTPNERSALGFDQLEPHLPTMPRDVPDITPPPEIHPQVTDISNEVDAAYEEVQVLEDDIDMVLHGEMTTAFLDKWGMTPDGGWGRTEQAMAEAVHKALRKEHEAELEDLEALLVLAKERRLSTRQLDEMGLKIPSDIRNPTEEELAKATEQRVYMESLAQNLKTNKRLTAEEKTRVKATIDGLRAEISKLENPRHIKRSPSYGKRRFESRYLAAERKLQKRIAAKKATLKEIGDEVGFAGKDPREYQRIAVMGVLNRRHRKAVIRYERAVAAESAHTLSVIRGLDALARQSSDAKEIARIRDLKIQFIQAQRLRLEHLNNAIEDQVALRDQIESSLGKLVGGGDPWELAGEARRGNRPIPYYTPDEMLKLDKKGRMGLSEGSILAPRIQADVYRSRSILMRTGLLALHPDTLSPAYFRAAKHDLNTEMHGTAMKLATRIGKNEALPGGYEFLRRTRGETISETAKHRGEHLSAMEHQFGREEDLSTTDPGSSDIDFTEADGSEYRLIIPKAYADEFRSEGLRSQGAIGRIFTKSMDVWRSLVLHLRIPWLVNNVVGNTFLFAMRFAGLQGLQEFARMVASNPVSRKYIPAMHRLAVEHLTPEQVRQIFPEQVRGTHFETQAPELPNVLPRGVRDPLEETATGKRFVQTLSDIPRYLPQADKAYERKLRQAATNMVLRASPEVKSIYKQMKRQGTNDFHAAVTKAIEGDPNFRDHVVREVNDALGNFLSLSRGERSILRRTVPFYAWMREISRISGRTLIDHPARVLFLQQMAQVSAEIQAQDIPSYMGGAVLADKAGWLGRLLGGDKEGLTSALSVHGMSPWATVGDIYQGARALGPGSNAYNVREFAGNFTPAIAGAYSIAARSEQGNLLKRYAEELLRSFPQSQIIAPYDSPMYPQRGRVQNLLKNLGDVRVQFDPEEASYQRYLGR